MQPPSRPRCPCARRTATLCLAPGSPRGSDGPRPIAAARRGRPRRREFRARLRRRSRLRATVEAAAWPRDRGPFLTPPRPHRAAQSARSGAAPERRERPERRRGGKATFHWTSLSDARATGGHSEDPVKPTEVRTPMHQHDSSLA